MKSNPRKFLVTLLGALILLLFGPVSLWSQSAGGSISGYVYDATGAVVPDTTVQVTNTGTSLSRTVKSDNRGYYIATPLPVGTYDVVFTHDGFAELKRTGVYVEVGQSAALDARLKVGGAQEVVVVEETAPLIEAGKTGAESVIVDTEIRELPLNNRNWNDLAILLPGVSPDAEFDSPATVSINGQEGAFNNIQVDGVDNNNTFFAELRGRSRAPFQYSQETVQEFRIQNTAYSAEHGRSAGGIVNAVTKSGTNAWHGSGFWYIRDNALNAAPFFAKQAGLGKPEGRRQQFGGTLGGPLKRDKLFLFFSYDQQVRRDPVAIVFDAQTFNELNFDPRSVLNTTTNFSTASNSFFDTVDGGGNLTLNFTVVSAFERDVVQQAFLNWAFARAYFLGDTSFLDQTFMIAGTNVTTINPFPGRQFSSVPRIGDRNPNQITFFPKITWIINPNHNLSAQWNYQDFEVGPNGIETQASQDENQSASGTDKNRSDAIVANLNSVFGPRWVNEFRFQYVRDDADRSTNAPGLSEIGMASFDLGGRGSAPNFTHEDKWQWQNNTSWLHGRHQVKFGGDVVLTLDDNFFPNDFNGEYDFDGPGHWIELSRDFIATTVNAAAGRNYFGINAGGTGPRPVTLARFLIDDFTQRFGQALTRHTTVDYGFFVQDTFQVSPQLTLNLGLRYEFQKLQDPVLSNPLFPESERINQDKNNFAPRIGLAWAPSKNIVFRAGYGFFYIRTAQIDVQAALAANNAFSFSQFLNGGADTDNANVTDFNPAALDPLNLQASDFPILSMPTTACPMPPACADPFARVSAFAPGRENGYTQQASAELQWELAPKHSFTLGYIYTKGTKLPRNRNINVRDQAFAESDPLVASFFDAGGNLIQTVNIPDYKANVIANRPNPNFNSITLNESAANTSYHALVAGFERRWDDGLVAGASYTWSHNYGEISNGFNNSGEFFSDLSDQNQPELERGNSRLDQRHRFVGRAVWEPQFWRKSAGATRWLLDGWSSGFIYTAATGLAITPVMRADVNNDNSRTAFGDGDRVPFFSRGSVRVQGRNQLDLSIYKRFRMGEGRSLQFRAQAFNLANRTTFTRFDDVMFNVANGNDPSTLVVEDRIMTPNPTFLQPEGRSLRNRDIQLGLVFRF